MRKGPGICLLAADGRHLEFLGLVTVSSAVPSAAARPVRRPEADAAVDDETLHVETELMPRTPCSATLMHVSRLMSSSMERNWCAGAAPARVVQLPDGSSVRGTTGEPVGEGRWCRTARLSVLKAVGYQQCSSGQRPVSLRRRSETQSTTVLTSPCDSIEIGIPRDRRPPLNRPMAVVRC